MRGQRKRHIQVCTELKLRRKRPSECTVRLMLRCKESRGPLTGCDRSPISFSPAPPDAILPRCHGLAPWRFTVTAKKGIGFFPGCHGLAPWRFTVTAKKEVLDSSLDATALRRGDSRSLLMRNARGVIAKRV